MARPNKRLKLTGGDRSNGSGLLCPWRGTDFRQPPLRQRAGRPQLKRDPLGSPFIATVNFQLARRVTVVLLIPFGVIVVLSRPVGLPWQVGAILVAVGLFDLVWSLRRSRSISPELDAVLNEAARIEKNDPAAAGQLLDQHFQNEAARREQERNSLRQRVQYDVNAAKRLEALLRQDLDGHRLMRRRVIPTIPDEKRFAAMTQLEEMERQTRSELDHLRASMRLLKG